MEERRINHNGTNLDTKLYKIESKINVMKVAIESLMNEMATIKLLMANLKETENLLNESLTVLKQKKEENPNGKS